MPTKSNQPMRWLTTLSSVFGFKIIISSSAGTSFSDDDSIAGARIYSASLDPADRDYIGKVLNTDPNWMITKDKIGNAKFMHCLPVRRNVVVEDAVLDSDSSLVIQQANNRTYAAQLVLKKILEDL